jgi:hypothetical protein
MDYARAFVSFKIQHGIRESRTQHALISHVLCVCMRVGIELYSSVNVLRMTSKEHLVEAAERSPTRHQAGQAGCKAGVGEVARPQVIFRAVAEVVALLEEESGHACDKKVVNSAALGTAASALLGV